MPMLKRIELNGSNTNDVIVPLETQYLVSVCGCWHAGAFDRQWYGLNFTNYGSEGIALEVLMKSTRSPKTCRAQQRHFRRRISRTHKRTTQQGSLEPGESKPHRRGRYRDWSVYVINRIWYALFDVPFRWHLPRGEGDHLPLVIVWGVLFAVTGICLWILNVRLRAREVVRG